MTTQRVHIARQRSCAEPSDAYAEARKRLAGRTSFVQLIPSDRLREVVRTEVTVNVGHYPEENH